MIDDEVSAYMPVTHRESWATCRLLLRGFAHPEWQRSRGFGISWKFLRLGWHWAGDRKIRDYSFQFTIAFYWTIRFIWGWER